MTNKLVVIINSLKVPKIKKMLLYEMKFLVPNYSCLQDPWLGGYRPQIPFLSLSSVLNWICWTPPTTPPRTKVLDTPLPTCLLSLHWSSCIFLLYQYRCCSVCVGSTGCCQQYFVLVCMLVLVTVVGSILLHTYWLHSISLLFLL